MAKDWSKARSLLKQLGECIGDEDEGENPSLPKQKQDLNDGGQESLTSLAPLEGFNEGGGEKKKKSINLMASALSSKFKK